MKTIAMTLIALFTLGLAACTNDGGGSSKVESCTTDPPECTSVKVN